MAKYANDGMLRVQLVTAVANIQAPSAATELNVGTHVTGYVTKDGLTVPADQNNVDVATLAEVYNAQVPGSYGGAVEITGMRDNAADTLWDLITYNLQRYIAVRRGVPTATAFAAGQKVEIYPATFHHPVPDQTGGDEVSRFTISAPCWSEPALKATVAA